MIKISKEGVPVQTAEDKDLIFNGDYPLFKIHKQGNGSVTTTGGSATIDITHDVGKIPMYFVWMEEIDASTAKTGKYVPLPFSWPGFAGLWGWYIVIPDNTKIRIQLDTLSTAVTLKYYYFIFEDPIQNV